MGVNDVAVVFELEERTAVETQRPHQASQGIFDAAVDVAGREVDEFRSDLADQPLELQALVEHGLEPGMTIALRTIDDRGEDERRAPERKQRQ
jgi:hypothetical protein